MYKIMIACILIVVFAAAALSGAVAAQDAGNTSSDIIDITGTVQHFSFEGGFYGIAGDDGKTYKPLELSPGFETEGRRVRARVRVIDRKLLFSGWGVPVEILEIENLE